MTPFLDKIPKNFNGRFGFLVRNLQTEEEIGYHADEPFPAASTVKLPLLAALMAQIVAGEYSLDDPLMLRRADIIGGSGMTQFLTPGLTMSIRDWAFLMMRISDNTATNILIDHVGLAFVADWLAANNFPGISLRNKIDFAAIAQDVNHLGTATPRGLNKLMTAVFQQTILTPAACTEMLRMMDKVGSDRIGRYLPWEPYGDLTPDDEKLHLAGKTGSLKGCRAQTAVVWHGDSKKQHGFTITVMTDEDPAPEIWSIDAAGVLLIGRIARAAYDEIIGGSVSGHQ